MGLGLAVGLTGCAGTVPSSSQVEPTALVQVLTQVDAQKIITNSSSETNAGKPAADPFTLENCGLSYTYETSPKRAVTMNQGATEIMLALGLAGKMVGTAYLDDKILPEYQAAYQKIPVLAKEYPSQEVLFAAEPDFVYGAYSSAFEAEAAGSREELLKVGIASYVSPAACADKALRPNVVTIDTVYGEIRDMGQIFDVADRAETLISGMQARLDEIKAKIGTDTQPINIFWFDSGDKEPEAGACCGAPNEIMRLAGAKNIFADAAGSWATVSWEEVVVRNPEAIVLAHAEWSTAEEKIALLKNTPAYADITAVRQGRFIIIPFSATTPGIRNISAVEELARGLYPEKFGK